MNESKGERWFWRLAGLTAFVGSVLYYTSFLPGSARLFGPAVGLLSLIAAIVWFVRARDARRGFAERAERLERQRWATTLPGSSGTPSALEPRTREELS
jgi:hypothetical protein